MTLLNLLDRFENAAGVYERSDKKADRDELHAARRAIMEAFEAVSPSPEPAAYISPREMSHIKQGSVASLGPKSYERTIPVYASPPAPAVSLEAELVKALEPFEEIACEGNEDQPDNTKCVIHAGRSIDYTTTLGDFRRLRAALRSSQQNT